MSTFEPIGLDEQVQLNGHDTSGVECDSIQEEHCPIATKQRMGHAVHSERPSLFMSLLAYVSRRTRHAQRMVK